MNYEIHIRDTENSGDPLILEYAERDSIRLNYLGGDVREAGIIGSELILSMEVLGGVDGKYIQYFTSNEQKWEVKNIISYQQDNPELEQYGGTVIWQGYLLPESYTEPWANPTFYPQFSAVDGLGLLKGKKLTDDFYEEEKSVIEIISACLKLTAIDFDIYFSPAIENSHTKDWSKIYVDTRSYVNDKEEKKSAHDILKDLMKALRCRLFQCEGRWYVEGVNKLHLKDVKFDKYSITGEFLGSLDLTKNVKNVDWYPTPSLTMVPALKEAIVTHEAEQVEFPKNIIRENDIDWKTLPGVTYEIYPKHWNITENYQPTMKAPDYFLELPINGEWTVNKNLNIDLKDKLYVLKGWRIRMEMAFELVPTRNLFSYEIDDHVDGDWLNALTYEVYHNNTRIASNLLFGTIEEYPNMHLKFESDLKASCHFEYDVLEDGFIDVKFYAPWGFQSQKDISAVKCTKLTIEKKQQLDDYEYTEKIQENSSLIEKIELPLADDVTGLSPSFYLEKKREESPTNYFKIKVPIEGEFEQDGKFYHVVSLKHANLIERNINDVHYGRRFNTLENLEVIYNFDGGDQMVIKADALMPGDWYVRVRSYVETNIDRSKWIDWTDAIYGVEKKRYGQVIAEIEGKLNSVPHLRIEASAMAPLKLNDLIEFTYLEEKRYFVITQLDWSPDNNESSIVLVEGMYKGAPLGAIPPYIYAGPDLTLSNDQTSIQITEAVASDPNGFITSLNWSKVTGDAGESFSNKTALNPLILGLTGDEYEFKLDAIDNEGLSGTDTMKIKRISSYSLNYNTVKEFDGYGNSSDYFLGRYKIEVTPEIANNDQLNLNFTASIKVSGVRLSTTIKVFRGDKVIYLIGDPEKGVSDENFEEPGTISYRAGDNIIVEFYSKWNPVGGPSTVDFSFRVTSADFKNGKGVIADLPVIKSYTHVKAD